MGLDPPHPVLAVIGASGGVGASVVAAALAAGVRYSPAMLIDLDDRGGGVDYVLGIEAVDGLRWGDLRLAGGALDPLRLRERLPRWGDVRVLALRGAPGERAAPGGRGARAPGDLAGLDPEAVAQVVDAAASAGPVVLDVPRWLPPCVLPALARADAVALVCNADVSSVVGARSVSARLAGCGVVPTMAIVRPGLVAADRTRAVVGVDVVVDLAAHAWLGGDSSGALVPDRMPAVVTRAVQEVWRLAAPRVPA